MYLPLAKWFATKVTTQFTLNQISTTKVPQLQRKWLQQLTTVTRSTTVGCAAVGHPVVAPEGWGPWPAAAPQFGPTIPAGFAPRPGREAGREIIGDPR